MVQTPAELQPAYAGVSRVEDDRKVRLGRDYLQLLAAEARFDCSSICQHSDNCGVDVRIEVRERLDAQARVTEFGLDFQLRATSRKIPVVDSKLLFPLEVDRYESLRGIAQDRPGFIVLLNLPTDFDGSDALAAEDLVTHRLGRWLCLHGAPQTSNTTATPVRFPTWNVFTAAALREIARRVSIGGRFFHEQ
jgi:Domain of unknown function (DUF4365)